MRIIFGYVMFACIPIVALIMTAHEWGWIEAIKIWGAVVGIVGWLCFTAWLLHSAS